MQLAPLRPKRPWWLLAAGIPILAAVAVAFAAAQFGRLPLTRPLARARGSEPAAAAPLLAKGTSVPFEVCYYNGQWAPPDADLQGQHLQGDPRYLDLATTPSALAQERVHVEVGPFRSTSAFTDFVQLSGLWTDPNATASACPAELVGKAELWALQLRMRRFELSGQDFVGYAEPQPAGVEVTQVAIPSEAVALHVLDTNGAKLTPDVALRG